MHRAENKQFFIAQNKQIDSTLLVRKEREIKTNGKENFEKYK